MLAEMQIEKSKTTARRLRRLGATALMAGLAAGCSANAVRLSEPIFTGSTPNQQQIISGQATAYSPPNYGAPSVGPVYSTADAASGSGGAISRQDLPAPSTAATQPTAVAAAPAAAAEPKPYTPPKPYAASGLPPPIGQVQQTAALGSAGQTPAADGAAAPAQLPTPRGAPPTTLAQQAQSLNRQTAAPAGSYTVQSGDSLWSVASRHGVTSEALAAANGLTGTSLRVGQTLVIPSAATAPAATQVASLDPQSMPVTDAVGAAAPQVPAQAQAQPQATQPAAEQTAALVPQAPAAAPEPAQPQVSGGFRWPARGRVISSFGKKPNGERNDGINLAVPEGTGVKAAEDGEVIYSGNELKSFGNLVLVRHPNGWVSAYAHNKELKVKKGEQVRRGQIIALSGMSGGVTSPQLHFELRKGATPVDPLSYLSDV